MSWNSGVSSCLNMVCVVLHSCVPAMETAFTAFEFYTKAIGWKVSQHVVPAAVMGRALLSSLPSDSQEPCSLTWVVLTFTALFQASHTPPFCFLWKNRKSCLQLFPALWTKELLHTHRRTHAHTHTHSLQCRPTHILLFCPSPQPEFRMPLSDVKMTQGMMGWNQKHFCFPFHNKGPTCS